MALRFMILRSIQGFLSGAMELSAALVVVFVLEINNAISKVVEQFKSPVTDVTAYQPKVRSHSRMAPVRISKPHGTIRSGRTAATTFKEN
jgi:hypothetical protein